MRSEHREPPREGPRSDINVTPLVDVCLVLLIIFMVVAPMLGREEIRLPRAAHPAKRDDAGKILLTLRKDGSAWCRGAPIPVEELTAALRTLRERGVGEELVLLADERLAFADVRRTMRLVHAAGFSGVNLAAKREDR